MDIVQHLAVCSVEGRTNKHHIELSKFPTNPHFTRFPRGGEDISAHMCIPEFHVDDRVLRDINIEIGLEYLFR